MIISFVKSILRTVLKIPKGGSINIESFIHYRRLEYGRRKYNQKYSSKDVIDAMCRMGLHEGSSLIVHCSWDEFYNCTSSPMDLIKGILDVIGPTGTLAMPAYPLHFEKKFDVKKSVTGAGVLAEMFRRYPGVKRSIHVKHSVCAIGPQSDFLLSEHHLGETCWDEKSPYYKLSQINAMVFVLGLGKYWPGTICHCVESVLRGKYPYYTDMFLPNKTEYQYIDYDGVKRSYWNYDLPKSGRKIRIIGYFKQRNIIRRYLQGEYQQVSNLQIAKYDALYELSTLLSLAKKGKDIYIMPLKWGYSFSK